MAGTILDAQTVSYFAEKVADHDSWEFIVASLVGSFLGTLGAAMIIITSLKLRTPSMVNKIIRNISIFDLFISFPIFVLNVLHLELHLSHSEDHSSNAWWTESKYCKIQSYITTTAAMLSFLWTMALSQHVFLLLAYGVKGAHIVYVVMYPLSIIPFAVNGLGFAYNVLGQDFRLEIPEKVDGASGHYHSVSWCWINVTKDETNKTWLEQKCPATFWEGKGWEILAYLGVLIYSTLTYIRLRRIQNAAPLNEDMVGSDAFERSALLTNTSRQSMNSSVRGANLKIMKLLGIPAVFVSFRIWGTIFRLACNCGSDEEGSITMRTCQSDFLFFMMSLFDPMQGMANFILYWKSLRQEDRVAESASCCIFPSIRGSRRPNNPSSRDPVTVVVPCCGDDII